MSRREWLACAGATVGLLAAHRAPAWLAALSGWPELAAQEPASARYIGALIVLPLPFVGAAVACALLNFAEVHGLAGPQRGRRRPLPAYPFEPRRTQLVIGETHQQDGSRSEQPGWLVLPEKGLYAGIAMLGTAIPVLAGMVFADRFLGKKTVGMTYLGEGGTSTGAFHRQPGAGYSQKGRRNPAGRIRTIGADFG